MFRDRTHAGRALATALREGGATADLVLGLPRGGVPVAAEVASALAAPLDVFVVRKLGTPGSPEVAMGAIASGGIRVLNARIADRVPAEALERVAAREQVELERRERAYRGDRPPLSLSGRRVLLVDDGLATGATVRAAVEAVRAGGALHVTVAAPVGAPDACARVGEVADDVVCLHRPPDFRAVGLHYDDFGQTTDAEVLHLLGAS